MNILQWNAVLNLVELEERFTLFDSIYCLHFLCQNQGLPIFGHSQSIQ